MRRAEGYYSVSRKYVILIADTAPTMKKIANPNISGFYRVGSHKFSYCKLSPRAPPHLISKWSLSVPALAPAWSRILRMAGFPAPAATCNAACPLLSYTFSNSVLNKKGLTIFGIRCLQKKNLRQGRRPHRVIFLPLQYKWLTILYASLPYFPYSYSDQL